MSDSFITIMIVLIAAILIFMVPVMAVSHRNDVTSTQAAQTAVTEFVDKARISGNIKQADYDSLLEKLEATGNVYDLRVSIQYIDENPSKKSTSDPVDSVKIGENVYYVEYTTQIEDAFKKTTDGVIKLEAGDYVKVDVENKNQTIYQSLKRTLYNLTAGQVGTIEGMHVALVIETTDGEQVGGETPGGTGETFVINYNANGGDQSTCPPTQTKNKGEQITLSTIKPEWPGTNLRFAGWAETPDATSIDYLSGGIFVKDKNTTLYAVWKEVTYNVVYLPNISQTVTGLPEQDTGLLQGNSYTIWEGRDVPTTNAATFNGWNTKADGTGTAYNSGDIITINESLVLYATWRFDKFTLIYDANADGDIVNNMPASGNEYYYHEQFTIPDNIPTRDNYDFLGWSINPSVTAAQYQPGDTCSMSPGNTTLYAIWGNAHTLKYNSNLAVLVAGYNNDAWIESAVQHLNSTEQFYAIGMSITTGGLDDVVAQKNNYDLIIVNANQFASSSIDSNARSKLITIAEATNLITLGNDESSIPLIEDYGNLKDTNMTITANSKGNAYMGGIEINQQTDNSLNWIRFHSNVTVLYTAKYIDKNGSGETKGEGDAIGFCKWRDNTNWVHGQIAGYQIDNNEVLSELAKIAINGLENVEKVVENIPEDETHFANAEFRLSEKTPVRKGFTFKGWSETPGGKMKYNPGAKFIMPERDVTLYAVWDARLEYASNIKVLVVGYNNNGYENDNWANKTANHLSRTGEFYADWMTVQAGGLNVVAAKKNEYDLIIVHGYAWAPSSINGINTLKEIANTTNLITIGNDEYRVPLINKTTQLTNVYVYPETTAIGESLIGQTIERQQDSNLRLAKFNSDVTVLYTANYKSKSDSSDLGTGDAIGYMKWGTNTNWVHSQIAAVSEELTYKLTIIALKGLDINSELVKNMPKTEYHANSESFRISSEEPTRIGYKFMGWATTPTGSVQYQPGDSFKMGKGNVRLYAVWQANQYTITFDANGGETPNPTSKMVVYNAAYGKLATCSRKGYIFAGWFTDPIGGTEIKESTLVKTDYDQTLYAHWNIENYTITYNLNNGVETIANPKTYTVETDTFTLNNPQREGYTFLGWTGSNGNTPQITITISKGSIGDRNYTANWNENKYTITFNGNGGEEPNPTTKVVTYNSPYGTLATTVRPGYTLKGWYTASTGGTKIDENSIVSIASNHTLYAQWTECTYTLTYDANGGANPPAAETRAYNSTKALSTTIPTKTGHDFLGWSTSNTAATATYASGANYTMPANNVTLYAVWSAKTYTLTYNANGGSNPPAAETRIYNSTKTLSTTIPTRTGYNFLGWSTSSAATTATYASGANYTMPANNVTLYAVWKIKTYTITYNANGGTGAPSAQTKNHGENLTLSTKAPTRTGYNFLGWGTSSTTTTVSYQSGGTYSANASATLYAVWEEAVAVTSVTLNKTEAQWIKNNGSKITLTATVAPTNATNKTVTWTSSNSEVATVSGGTVTAKSAGVTTITATAGGKSASVKVYVYNAEYKSSTGQYVYSTTSTSGDYDSIIYNGDKVILNTVKTSWHKILYSTNSEIVNGYIWIVAGGDEASERYNTYGFDWTY